MLIKGAMEQEEIAIINLYVLNVDETNIIKHILKDLKTQMDPNTGVVGDFYNPL
jgi:hypothetical protein